MGVMVSPAPLITPDRHWVTAMAIYPTASICMRCMLNSTSSFVSVKIPIRYLPKIRINEVITADMTAAMMVPSLAPFSTLSYFLAPTFCPAYVVIAVPKEKFGIMAKPSTRMIITFAAMNISPKLLVRDCTIIIAMEKIACVNPEGSPRRIMSAECFFSGFR